MNNPFVSIIIPAYNPGKYILDTIKSVLNQTYQNIEIILVDDGSTEPLENLIQEYFPDNEKINYYSKENGGLSSARNFGITKATGDFIAFLDSDDCWTNNKLEIQIKYVSKYDLIYSKYLIIDQYNNLYNIYNDKLNYREIVDYKKDLLHGNYIYGSGSAVLISKALIEKVGFFDTKLTFGEDWDYWLRCAYLNASFLFINQCLVFIRKHNNSMQSLASNNEKFDNETKILYKFKGEIIAKKLIHEITFINSCRYRVSIDRYSRSLFNWVKLDLSIRAIKKIIIYSFKYFIIQIKFLIKSYLKFYASN